MKAPEVSTMQKIARIVPSRCLDGVPLTYCLEFQSGRRESNNI